MRVNADALYSSLLSDLSAYIDVKLPSFAPDSTAREAACFALRDSLMKKFMGTDKPLPPACTAALKKFRAVNERCKGYEIPYEFSQDEMLVEGVKSALHAFWFRDEESSPDRYAPLVSDYREIFLRGRAGPGASLGARDTDFYTKMMDSTLTATSDLPIVWGRCVSMTALTDDAERHRNQLHGITVVDSSKYSFVNKTTTIARGICTEPSINMWFQLGLGAILEDRLRGRFGVDINGTTPLRGAWWRRDERGSQPYVNRVLARAGSIDGSFSTIDLESASDSMAIDVLKVILPRSLFALLMTLRSPTTTLPNGERVELNMVSTMGNGFTFPLMTAIFCSVVQSVYQYLGIPLKGRGLAESRNFGVFGDDIIVVPEATRLVLRTLHLLGFIVNTDKTFVEGRFRESCGADYIDGINVRGVYIKSLRTEQDLFVAINNLNRWSTKTGCSLPCTVALLLTGVRNPLRRFVPPDEDDSAGIHVPVDYARLKKYKSTRNGLISYYASVPQKWEFLIIGGHCWTYKEQVRRNYNPSGLMIAFLAGGIRGYSVALRQRAIRYTTKRKATPCWGYLPPRPLEDPHGSSRCRRFVDACERNFVNSAFWSEPS
ncbi:TPA_asm: RNA-directed RNA polymerase [ssRNA phage Esthiorhiza.2_15]|uniref:RNA-directed RNA polymerase n=2 Tax=Norzivirales TaxID=2842247 RepID=A0A8S5L4H7_9VIRU|nr:RNA-directed RNA polymerase [ssRNA phage Esthiorhiza.2_15]QDH90674.1 MAG: RNA-dependent RNA polymerase [Leviviridae sp.]DAD52098.1 TPA_asm: RNA-directed RNA polymerase [ssRNA phage Esthiorhiza.2_15]